MSVRTHVSFWDAEQMASLRAEVERLADDWDERRGYVDAEMRTAGDARVALLRSAVAVAAEEAD